MEVKSAPGHERIAFRSRREAERVSGFQPHGPRMPADLFTVVGLGEVLWDLFPSGKQLGGAPTNFAYMTNLLGDRGIVASRVGQDSLGDEAIRKLHELSLQTAGVQRDSGHPTGTVKVEVNPQGQPRFEIAEGVAWDFLQWTAEWRAMAQEADAVCFSSLGQRSPQSRQTMRAFLHTVPAHALRVFDVNLRQHFYSPEVISESLALADLVKMNHEEVPPVMQLLGLPQGTLAQSGQRILRRYQLKMVCITSGAAGSLLVTADALHEQAGLPVRVADTVGAGDAFTAALVHHYLRGAALERMNWAANRMGSWVASQVGGTPAPDKAQLQEMRSGR
jgi:fructokinase